MAARCWHRRPPQRIASRRSGPPSWPPSQTRSSLPKRRRSTWRFGQRLPTSLKSSWLMSCAQRHQWSSGPGPYSAFRTVRNDVSSCRGRLSHACAWGCPIDRSFEYPRSHQTIVPNTIRPAIQCLCFRRGSLFDYQKDALREFLVAVKACPPHGSWLRTARR